MTNSQVARSILAMSGPITLAYLAEIAMLLTNMAFVGRVGTSELAAVGLASGITYPLIFCAASLTSTSSVLAADMRGAEGGLSRVFAAGVVTSAIAIPVLLITAFATIWLSSLSLADPEFRSLVFQFTIVFVWAIPFILLFNVYRGILTTIDRTRTIALAAIVSVIANAILNYAFVVSLGWGVGGSAFATVLANVALVLVLAGLSHRWIGFAPLDGLRTACSLAPTVRDYFRVGLPIALLGLVESGMFLVLTAFATRFGVAFLAAHTVAINLSDIAIAFAFGIGEAVTAKVALQRQDGAVADCRRTVRMGVLLVVSITAPISAAIALHPEFAASLFLGAEEKVTVLPHFTPLAFVLALILIFDGIQSVQYRALKGLRDVNIPFAIALTSYWGVGVVIGLLLAAFSSLGGLGLWVGLLFGLLTASALLAWRLSGVVTRLSPGQADIASNARGL